MKFKTYETSDGFKIDYIVHEVPQGKFTSKMKYELVFPLLAGVNEQGAPVIRPSFSYEFIADPNNKEVSFDCLNSVMKMSLDIFGGDNTETLLFLNFLFDCTVWSKKVWGVIEKKEDSKELPF